MYGRTISNTNYFKNIKNKCWGVVSHLGLLGSWDSPPPPQAEGPGDQGIPKWEKLEYCNTIKIILYKFEIIFHKAFSKFKKKLLKKSFRQYVKGLRQ